MHVNAMAQPKRRRIAAANNSKQASLLKYCLPTRIEGQLSSQVATQS